jgi:hypothetical protein
MKDTLTKFAGRGVILHRYGKSKKGISYPALGTAAGILMLFTLLPGGNFFGDLLTSAVVGETYLLVAAAKDPERKDTFHDD